MKLQAPGLIFIALLTAIAASKKNHDPHITSAKKNNDPHITATKKNNDHHSKQRHDTNRYHEVNRFPLEVPHYSVRRDANTNEEVSRGREGSTTWHGELWNNKSELSIPSNRISFSQFGRGEA
jgi:hypothetical protein